MDFLEVINVESERFADALASIDPSANVPSCDGWDAAELLWHLTEVQSFWGTIVADRLTAPDAAETSKPTRPTDHSAAIELFRSASVKLVDGLKRSSPSDAVWTWSDDHTVGFVLRRQAHEAAIHRMDAELTARTPITPLDEDFATDGIDELLTVYAGGIPDWASFTPSGRIVELVVPGQRWLVSLGSMAGTSPASGTTYDALPALEVVADGEPDATITGAASDVDGWLWGRVELNRLDVEGDPSVVDALRATIADATQ